ncbi:DUF4232 domain-containing protein [Streptomyces lushanensis]|uniref:DUF4232 domain-containing protein n=1 Tax=Streptomyces lushanensis TaxID=1434255 RepID=UPI00082FE003|nr:DUF4232 domain-containing protein [Streptomyces lushanensis]
MSARINRTRTLAAAALAVAALTLTACDNGEGVHDEGASAASTATAPAAAKSPTASGTPSPGTEGGAPTAAGQAGSAHSADPAAKGSTGSTGGAAGSSGTTNTSRSTGSHGSASASAPCSGTSTRTTATVVSRPLNHLLLTVTNTGSKNCDLIGYPAVRFAEAQAVPPAIEDSKPQAVVTLAPGESGYASVLLSAADGSGSHGYTAKSLTVYFDKGQGAARPSLPAKGVYIDSSLSVSYWQSDMGDALAW